MKIPQGLVKTSEYRVCKLQKSVLWLETSLRELVSKVY